MKSLKPDAVYHDVLLFLPRAPSKDFKYIQDRLKAHLIGWRSKCLSWAGRSTPIKLVAQTLPTYVMSLFSIPSKICDSHDVASKRFWWKPKDLKGKYLA